MAAGTVTLLKRRVGAGKYGGARHRRRREDGRASGWPGAYITAGRSRQSNRFRLPQKTRRYRAGSSTAKGSAGWKTALHLPPAAGARGQTGPDHAFPPLRLGGPNSPPKAPWSVMAANVDRMVTLPAHLLPLAMEEFPQPVVPGVRLCGRGGREPRLRMQTGSSSISDITEEEEEEGGSSLEEDQALRSFLKTLDSLRGSVQERNKIPPPHQLVGDVRHAGRQAERQAVGPCEVKDSATLAVTFLSKLSVKIERIECVLDYELNVAGDEDRGLNQRASSLPLSLVLVLVFNYRAGGHREKIAERTRRAFGMIRFLTTSGTAGGDTGRA
ncbi:hypothetical protein DPEC_G00251360 [Dallia pectoralis]|uniref:Uncharacterized protein n=1 Tax=Dallia pectoralis TaxID=75939 RepID=A0ACC2FTC6_DALPE|nr:hypothetical protein DPEC_G00251360 [Dallia pectoralis]